MKKCLSSLLIGCMLLTACGCAGPAGDIQETPRSAFDTSASREADATEGPGQTESPEQTEDSSGDKDSSGGEKPVQTVTPDDVTAFQGFGDFIEEEFRNQTYNGEAITVEYQYNAVGSKSVGIIVYCDGEVTPFHTDVDGTDKAFHILPVLPKNETRTIPLTFTPIGNKGDTVKVLVASVVEPDYDVDSFDPAKDPAGIELTYGSKFMTDCYPIPVYIDMEQDGLEKSGSVSTRYTDTTPVPEDERSTDSSLHTQHIVVEKNRNGAPAGVSQFTSVKRGGKVEFEISLFGADRQGVMLSFFVGNELFPLFDGKDYARCDVRENYYTTITGTLDTSRLEPGRYGCYSNIGNEDNAPHRNPVNSFILEVTE